MARHLGVSEAAIAPPRRTGRSATGGATGGTAGAAPPARERSAGPLEDADLDLLACLLKEPGLLDGLSDLAGELGPRVRVVIAWLDEARVRGLTGVEDVVPHLFGRCADDPETRGILAAAVDRAARIRDPRSIFSLLRHGRNAHFARQEARRIRLLLQQAESEGDSPRADELTRRYVELLRLAGAASAERAET
jgi:hypothetical protein